MKKRRFIEDSFPVKAVSEISANEKNIRHGHISTLHIWWARRPLAASRATVYAALVPTYRDRLDWDNKMKFIVDLSKWENSNNARLIEKARKEILEANGNRPPRVIDPFAGGGSFPLEALRLGCETYANDYNPVAVLIEKATLEFPQRFGSTESEEKSWGDLKTPGGKAKNRLLEAVEKWGNWVKEEAEKELGGFYKGIHENEIPVGYIWARTVPCQNPSCGIMIPLMRQFWLAKKPKRMIALHPVVRGAGNDVEFEIVGKDVQGYKPWPENFEPANGTVSRAKVRCPACGTTIDDKTTRRLFIEGKAGQRMVVVVFTDAEEGGKGYRLATEKDFEMFKGAEKYLEKKRQELKDKWGIDPVPDEPLVRVPVSFGVINVWVYGMNTWGDLFNSRQKLALITFVEKVRQAHEKMLAEGMEEDFAKAVICYLGFVVSRIPDANSVICHWDGGWEKTATTFARQALPMNWDYIEANVVGEKGYNFKNILDTILLVLEKISDASSFVPTIPQSPDTSLSEEEENGGDEE
ncbi:MAG: DUF1156 domain-containing protein [Thermoplasmata archaeon]